MRTDRGSCLAPLVFVALAAVAIGCNKKSTGGDDPAPAASKTTKKKAPKGEDDLASAASDPAAMTPAGAASQGLSLYDAEPSDMKGAKDAFTSACDRGDKTGCMGVGLVAVWGEPHDYARGFKLLDAACSGGQMRGCAALGKLHLNGWGTEKDIAKAKSFFEKACDASEPRGCHMLGVMMTATDAPADWGPVVKHDVKAGLAAFKKACDAGYKDSCDTAKKAQAFLDIEELRKKIKVERGLDYMDEKCTSDGKPPKALSFTGGTYKENETVAIDRGCVHLHVVSDYTPPDQSFNDYCCPK